MHSESLGSKSSNAIGSMLLCKSKEIKGAVSEPLSCCAVQGFQSFIDLFILYFIREYAT